MPFLESSPHVNGDVVGGDEDSLAAESSVPLHPLGVKPLGNQYLSGVPNARRRAGAFQALPDEVLAVLLESFDAATLLVLGATCKFLYAFCRSDDLWKGLFLGSHEKTSSFTWRGSWRSTLLDLPKDKRAAVDCSNVYSDVLHRPFVCSHIALDGYASSIPRGNEIRRFENLTYDEFARDWSDRPFILTKCTQDWPASRSWNLDELLRRYGDVEFRAEAVDWAFSTYYAYLRDNDDESPLYLFDRRFAEKMGISVGRGPDEQGGKFAYWNPECFGTDLFEVLGAERPAHRWLIAGPARSGSTFHKDPNGTSAWNAVVQGAKYWILFPPSAAVPGVYESRDGGEVTSPLSIAEWLLSFHAEARRTPGCVEGVCRAGEMVHVPSGWWHLVVNLEAGVAITQNFVPAAHLAEVLGFLRDRADQTSGFKREVADPYGLFVERLRERHPQLLEAALEELEARRSRRKKRRWEAVAGGSDAEEGGPTKSSAFCFGFAEDDEEVP